MPGLVQSKRPATAMGSMPCSNRPSKRFNLQDYLYGDEFHRARCIMSEEHLRHIRDMEVCPKRRPRPDYMEEVQAHVNAGMRERLVDWLVDLSHYFGFQQTTLFLAINYLDRYLSSNIALPGMLQILGVGCLFLASKFEERQATFPEKKFALIENDICTKREMLTMESEILRLFKFGIWDPTAMSFLTIFTTAQADRIMTFADSRQKNHKLECLSWYLAELTLLDYTCIQFLPSLIAASAIFLANFIFRPDIYPWTMPLQEKTGYKPSELKECVLVIHTLRLKAENGSLVAVKNKYSDPKFDGVAKIHCPVDIAMEYFEDMCWIY